MCLAQGLQRSDAGQAQTRGLSVWVKPSTTEPLLPGWIKKLYVFCHATAGPCADPESFSERVQLWLRFLFSWHHLKRAINRPASEMPFKWHFAGGTMVVKHWIFAVLQGILTSIAEKPYIFVTFQGGGGGGPDPYPPLWICACGHAFNWAQIYIQTISLWQLVMVA